MQKRKFKDFLSLSLILILSLCLYKDIIFAKARIISFAQSDILYFNTSFYYLTFALKNAWRISLWNPYIFLGQPLIGHPAGALFYPLNLIFFFLPLHLAINYSFLLNTVFLGTTVYIYIRYLKQGCFAALAAAIIFIFNGVVLLHTYAGHLSTLQTLPWLVLLFLCIEMCLRKNVLMPAILGGLVLGIQFLAGNAQYTFYTIMASSAYFLFCAFFDYAKNRNSRQLLFRLSCWGALILFGFAIAAIKLIPALEFIKLSDRAVTGLSFAGSWSFPPQNLITYILPGFYGDMLNFPYWGKSSLFWEMCGYVGILPLILSVIAVIYNRNRYTMFFAGLALVSLVGAMGEYTPLFKIFYYFLPGFSKFRGHSKMVILFAFSICVLCAYGLSWVLNRKRESENKRFKATLWSVGIISGLAVLFTILLNLNRQVPLKWLIGLIRSDNLSLDFVKGALNNILDSLFKFSFFITAGFGILFLWMRKNISLRIFQFLILVLIIADLWLFGSKYIVYQRLENCYWNRGMVNFLKEDGAPYRYRVMSPHFQGPFPNKALLDGLHMIDGYDAVFLKRYIDLLAWRSLDPVNSEENLKLLSLINLKFLLMPKSAKIKNPNLIPVYQTADTRVWQNLEVLPRAYIVHSAEVIQDSKERLSRILSDKLFDPLNTVILEEPVSPNFKNLKLSRRAHESVEFSKYSDDEIIIRTTLKDDGFLILSDLNYPGWKVYISNLRTGQNRRTVPLYANHVFRAVRLTPGEYSLRFVFEPGSFFSGASITILTLIAVMGVLILQILKWRRAS